MTVCTTFCPEPEPGTLFCIREYACDTFCQSIIAEENFPAVFEDFTISTAGAQEGTILPFALENKGESPVQKADKTALSSLLNRAAKLNQTDYTADTWKTLSDAVKAANALMQNEKAAQAEVNQTSSALENAIKNLKKTQVSKPDPVKQYQVLKM